MSNVLLISIIFAIIVCAVFLFIFEKRRPSARDILPIVIMCVIAAIGRVIFTFIPSVQPVTAIVIIMGVCYGPLTGFTTGCLSALISNLLMGQGPWTPWQMLAWGLIGLIAAGISCFKWGRNIFVLAIYGVLSGFLYSLIVDIWTISTLWEGMTFYMALGIFGVGLLSNIPHAVGNAIFTLILYKPFSKKLLRLQSKYGILKRKRGTKYE